MGREIGYVADEKSTDARAEQKTAVLDVRQPVGTVRQGMATIYSIVRARMVKRAFFPPQVNFSKKRKNRMRNDEAAIIAMSKSRSQFLNNKDTDILVDNEAVIVYDERTAL